MSDIFVTCIYNNLIGTKFGGRGRSLRYLRSLRVIAGIKTSIICFTSPDEIDALSKHFKDVPNITFKVMDLAESVYHERIQLLKSVGVNDDHHLVQARCFELMWGKFDMLRIVMADNPDCKRVYWIDAGLSHRDVFSHRFMKTSDIILDRTEITRGIFTPAMIPRLTEATRDGVLVFAHTTPNNQPLPAVYTRSGSTCGVGVIGGFFGGPVESVEAVIREAFRKIDITIHDNKLYTEESVLSSVLCDEPDLFKVVAFDTWYHDGWVDHFNSSLKNFSDEFTKLLVD